MTARVVHNQPGSYRFLGTEGRPFSNGAVADPAFDLVHVSFERPAALETGIEAAVRHVAGAGRPPHSLAGFELRIPRPLSQSDFDAFNRGYVALLRGIGLEIEGLMPAARTNVAPLTGKIDEPSVFGFTFTTPTTRAHARTAFILSGVPEEVEGDARAMLRNIIEVLAGRASQLGCQLDQATAVQLYAAGAVDPEVIKDVVAGLGDAAIHGLRWFPSRPPIEGLRYEIDLRAAGAELIIPA